MFVEVNESIRVPEAAGRAVCGRSNGFVVRAVDAGGRLHTASVVMIIPALQLWPPAAFEKARRRRWSPEAVSWTHSNMEVWGRTRRGRTGGGGRGGWNKTVRTLSCWLPW